ncbi:DUF4190 domain-containing protein [Nocardioides sp. GY 10113]|uniref:DUF4190 domain-containing protein n=1 Tax=Nocardioides sp. GY 10113 TaxID=2569761 RepID=UPI0010A8AF32|nr:DUF4190 domain-containing protein [Nocardioides sp. GY 10113]TIC87943.1 DUF4190 domain-containing protein [Nocardioides sp. GY 10113]
MSENPPPSGSDPYGQGGDAQPDGPQPPTNPYGQQPPPPPNPYGQQPPPPPNPYGQQPPPPPNPYGQQPPPPPNPYGQQPPPPPNPYGQQPPPPPNPYGQQPPPPPNPYGQQPPPPPNPYGQQPPPPPNPYGQQPPPPPNPYGQQPPPPPNPYGQQPPPPHPYGQQPPPNDPYGQPYPQAGGDDAPTDAVSITSFVLGVLCCTGPIGLVLGFIGLSRTKDGKRKGRWAAITGLVLSAIGTVALIVVVILAAAGVSWLDENVITPANAEAGQCVNITEDEETVVFLKRDCADDHEGEIVGTVEVTDENLDVIRSTMAAYCAKVVDPGTLLKVTTDPDVQLKAVTEHPDDPETGDHLVCYVQGEGLTGSLS